jgi:hypothetical protein
MFYNFLERIETSLGTIKIKFCVFYAFQNIPDPFSDPDVDRTLMTKPDVDLLKIISYLQHRLLFTTVFSSCVLSYNY